jgi:hypothetical protein
MVPLHTTNEHTKPPTSPTMRAFSVVLVIGAVLLSLSLLSAEAGPVACTIVWGYAWDSLSAWRPA